MTSASGGDLSGVLAKLTATAATTYRGLPEGVAAPGAAFALASVTATSRDLSVATEGGRHRRVVALLGRSGRDLAPLSARPADAEVVFLPGAVFVPVTRLVLPTASGGEFEVHVVEEVELSADGEALPRPASWPVGVQAVTEEVAAAAGRGVGPREDGAVAGKFAGPLP